MSSQIYNLDPDQIRRGRWGDRGIEFTTIEGLERI
jgi:hypothetical protein